MSDIVDDIIAYESEGLPEKKEKKLFQKLVNTGQAWQLQGAYGRRASELIQAGIVKMTPTAKRKLARIRAQRGF